MKCSTCKAPIDEDPLAPTLSCQFCGKVMNNPARAASSGSEYLFVEERSVPFVISKAEGDIIIEAPDSASVAEILADRDGNGIPDILEGRGGQGIPAEGSTLIVTSTPEAIVVDGVEYRRLEEIPADVQSLIEGDSAASAAFVSARSAMSDQGVWGGRSGPMIHPSAGFALWSAVVSVGLLIFAVMLGVCA